MLLLDNAQRGQWNGYLDSLNGQEVSPQTMADHAQANPGFSITPQMIPQIQSEHAAIRTGDSFGDLNPDQMQQLRAGVGGNFLGQTQLNQSYYPTFKKGSQDFGTNLEAYLSGEGGGGGGKTTKAPATQLTVHAAGPANQLVPAGAIPRPDYSSFKSRANYVNQLAAKYGNFVNDRNFTITRINDVPEGGNISARDSAIKEAQKQGLDPALFYSSAMEEGANGLYPDAKGNINTGADVTDDYPISGFANYGLDNFHGDFKELVRKGYLPKNFDYKPSYQVNENGDKVPSAIFRNTEDAMQAKAAYVRHYGDKLNEWATENKVTLSPLAKQFFTLISFNGGPGTAKKLIRYYQEKGLLKDDKFIDVDPGRQVDRANAYNHIHDRFKMANLLRKEGYFQ